MTEEGVLIQKDTEFEAEDNDELKVWLRRGLVAIINNKNIPKKKKKKSN